MKATRAKRINWADVRARLAENERSLSQALNPDEASIRTVRHRRMLELARRTVAPRTQEAEALVLVCRLAGERYGMEAAELSSVGRLAHCTPVRSGTPPVLGAFAWRGVVRTVVCLRSVLGLEAAPAAQVGDVILLPRRLHEQVAFRVDNVEQIVAVSEEAWIGGAEDQVHRSRFVRHRTKDGIGIIDVALLLRDPLFSRVDENAAAGSP